MSENISGAMTEPYRLGDWLNDLFPFHVVVDAELSVRRWGRSFAKVCPGAKIGVRIVDLFAPRSVDDPFDFAKLFAAEPRAVFLVSRESGVVVRGELRVMDTGSEMVFLCVPWLGDVKEPRLWGLEPSDFAIHNSEWELFHALRVPQEPLEHPDVVLVGSGANDEPLPVDLADPAPVAEPASADDVTEQSVHASPELPVGGEKATRGEEPQAGTGPVDQLPSLRVILAEDNRINRRFCLEVLKRMGIHADFAEDGVEALAKISRNPYDVVLMDWQMPEMDGLEATKAIRRLELERLHGGRRKLIIIALTANAMMGDRAKCLEAGMDDYLAKPFSAAQLEEMLRKHMAAQEETEKLFRRLGELSSELELDVVRSLVSDFAADLPFRIQELQELVLGSRMEEAERAAHSLKGVAQTFGLGEMSRLFAALEHASEAAQPEMMMQHLQALQRQLAPTIASLKSWLDAQAQGVATS